MNYTMRVTKEMCEEMKIEYIVCCGIVGHSVALLSFQLCICRDVSIILYWSDMT